jgi:hypothetical protein
MIKSPFRKPSASPLGFSSPTSYWTKPQIKLKNSNKSSSGNLKLLNSNENYSPRFNSQTNRIRQELHEVIKELKSATNYLLKPKTPAKL